MSSVIDPGARLGEGTTHGEGCVIGAGSFVNKDCEPWGIYVGSPARKIATRPK